MLKMITIGTVAIAIGAATVAAQKHETKDPVKTMDFIADKLDPTPRFRKEIWAEWRRLKKTPCAPTTLYFEFPWDKPPYVYGESIGITTTNHNVKVYYDRYQSNYRTLWEVFTEFKTKVVYWEDLVERTGLCKKS